MSEEKVGEERSCSSATELVLRQKQWGRTKYIHGSYEAGPTLNVGPTINTKCSDPLDMSQISPLKSTLVEKGKSPPPRPPVT